MGQNAIWSSGVLLKSTEDLREELQRNSESFQPMEGDFIYRHIEPRVPKCQ